MGDGFKFATFILIAAIALLCIGCTEARNTARFVGVDYVSCQKTKTIRNPDCFSVLDKVLPPADAGMTNSVPAINAARDQERRALSCKASPTVLACAEWLVVGGVSDCGIALNCKPRGTEE